MNDKANSHSDLGGIRAGNIRLSPGCPQVVGAWLAALPPPPKPAATACLSTPQTRPSAPILDPINSRESFFEFSWCSWKPLRRRNGTRCDGVYSGTSSWTGPNGFISTPRAICGVPLTSGNNVFTYTCVEPSAPRHLHRCQLENQLVACRTRAVQLLYERREAEARREST